MTTLDLICTKPTSAVVVVTPEMASRMLLRNLHNRNCSGSLVQNYARDMTSGVWYLNGESIKFAVDGTLLDGQHRLRAVVASGCSVPMFIVRGLPVETQPTMDQGRRRSAADALNLGGLKNASILAASAKFALGVMSNGYERAQWYKATTQEIATFVDANPSLIPAAEVASSVHRRIDCPPTLVAYASWRFSEISTAASADFFDAASHKVGLTDGDPVIALTDAFAELRRSRKRMPHEALLSGTFRAWNARRDGRIMRVVKFNSSAGGLIPVPEPR